MHSWQALVPPLDAQPIDDQEVAGSIPVGSGNILWEDWSWNIFYSQSLPSADSRTVVVSFWGKNVHKYWLTAKPA